MGETANARHLAGRAFVDRDREVAELAAALEDAVGGRGRLFLVAGEPGIGKTWLAEHPAGLADDTWGCVPIAGGGRRRPLDTNRTTVHTR